MVTVNGEEVAVAGTSIATLLTQRNAPVSNLAVELNGKIVPRSDFANVLLKENDKVEIISFVGGG
ncbi:sulfur carrier protein ThiS [Lactobacillus sp. ESL0679]|uniref:sulfur carrier protein ThiS n=1 Tax=Lactobacillus sp. ESL0679 TaxID=2983209 RepID=UPI0023F9AEBD|nr:sulfur carrier protein ThiS [Lactobacillus sp. ESL0679]MDF7682819.1 sulfur carrier protein ThiS [Lactobacillus sp. ESL0679]